MARLTARHLLHTTLIAALSAAPACGKKDPTPPPTTAPTATATPTATAPTANAEPDAGATAAAEDVAAPEPETVATAPTAGAISPDGTDARRPRVSPDGTRVVFHVGPEGKRDIVVVGIDGAAPATLVADAADDRDPSWAADGKRLVFSSNRSGRYDLYTLDLDKPDAPPAALGVDADAHEPTMSSLRYTFSVVTPDSCTSEGASGAEVDSYEKLAYTRLVGAKKEVWFRSLNGKHTGRLSPADASCWAPRYSPDGLSLLMTCADGAGEKRVVHDTLAAWDQSYKAALAAVGYSSESEDPGGCDGDPATWESDKCLSKLPRRYALHAAAPVADPTASFEGQGYATNHTLVLATNASGASTRERTATATWAALDVPGAGDVTGLDWSPDGAQVVLEQKRPDGTHTILRAPTSYYLQDVKDLDDYPELWGEGRSELLHKNRFVARPGEDKEFFHTYDKAMYARRGAFVTADATLQVVRDEIATLLKAAEADAAESLHALTKGLVDVYAAALDKGHNRYYATQLAVAWAALEAAKRVPADADEGEWQEEPPADAPAEKTPIEKIRGELAAVMKDVPAAIRADVEASISKALAHEGFTDITVPGRANPVPVDFSQMKPRGHYAESTLAGYFVAMKWLSMVPLPFDQSAVELVKILDDKGLMEHWTKIDQMVGAFMGRPIDVTVSHIKTVLAKSPGVLEPFDKDKATTELRALLGDLGIRGLATALADDSGEPAPAPELSFMLFPLRLGMDVPTFTGLTHPVVTNRGLPSAVDVFAAMGVPGADRIARAQAQGQEWQAKYEAALDKLRAKAPGRSDALWGTDLYHGWLALLQTMAEPMKTPAEARMLFTASSAWEDRLVSGALGGYAQLKHDAVLYAFQDFSAQCDSGTAYLVFVEQPVLPQPRGFVEPNPEFFRAAARLAKRAYDAFAGGVEPNATTPWGDEEENAPKTNAKTLSERLAKIAELELKSAPLSEEDLGFLRTIGGTFEAIFLAQQKTDGQSSGKGRLERGIALVTDIHTNVTSQVALHIGIGPVDRFYVVVPDVVGARMTEGGVFGFYEFDHPIADRLTDDQWYERIVGGTLPPRPTWVSSFFEPKLFARAKPEEKKPE